MPADGEQPVWLPIDSKFPGDTYAALQDAREQGDPAQVEAARQKLLSVVRSCAKDIRDKYVQPPYTTNFGILFLPFEGRGGEQRTGGTAPAGVQHQRCRTVMAAILNALQMGFRTLAIQKHSHEAWVVLGAVSTSSKSSPERSKRRRKVSRAQSSSWNFTGTRTRAIVRQLQMERLQPEELRRESE
ncbi:MAG: DNA recombination protein RmuC [Ruminococcus sp.]